MWHRHELGKSWSAKDGVVRSVKVGDEEVDVVNKEVLCGDELDQPGADLQGAAGAKAPPTAGEPMEPPLSPS